MARHASARAHWLQKCRNRDFGQQNQHVAVLIYLLYIVTHMASATAGAVVGEFEQLVLIALLRLGNGAFGAAIHREIVARAGRDITPAAVYVTLDRLEAKRMVCSYVGTPSRHAAAAAASTTCSTPPASARSSAPTARSSR